VDINIVKLKKYAKACSVLYVEDDELIRSQTATFLGRFFPDVVLAEDGAQGLALYKKREFDVVITDINMPNMNGIEMIEGIKEVYYDQLIIVTSAHNDSENLMKFINLDVSRFILKPFNNKQFLYVLYKIAEELTFSKESMNLQNEVIALSKKSQKIIDHIDLGIVLIKNNKISMANNAFLEIGGFDSYETLELEMPEIGVLFEAAKHCISVDTNVALIDELQQTSKEDSKVRIISNTKTIEYQVNLTHIEEDDSYIISFTDITALHNAMSIDEHTKLPLRKFILEKIDLLKQKSSILPLIYISIKHFTHVEKMFGKRAGTEIEVEFAIIIKNLVSIKLAKSFVGYFSKNAFVIIPIGNSGEIKELFKTLETIKVSSSVIEERHQNSKEPIELLANLKLKSLDTSKDLTQIEIEMINMFDLL